MSRIFTIQIRGFAAFSLFNVIHFEPLGPGQAAGNLGNVKLDQSPPLYLYFISYSLNEVLLKSHAVGQPIVNIFICCHFMVNKNCVCPRSLAGSSSVNIT